MVFLPVNPLGPFEHVHEGKSKSSKYCRPEFDGVLFYDMKQKYFGHEIFRCYGYLFFHI